MDTLRLCPTSPALSEGAVTASYADLHEKASLLSNRLVDYGIVRHSRVVIAIDRGIDATIAIFSVLYQGGCYVPLDLKNPSDRLAYIVDDVKPDAVIGIGERPSWCQTSITWVNFKETDDNIAQDVTPYCADPKDLATILYTSGSGGLPKGVALSHAAAACFSNWSAMTFDMNANQRVASLAPFFFDLSLFDIFTGLGHGAHILFVPSSLTLAPAKLTTWLAEQQISIWYTVPSILGFIAFKGNLANVSLPRLKTIMFAGEVFPTSKLSLLIKQLPLVDFYNLYGPTETNVCTYWAVDKNHLNIDSQIPIGSAACGAQLKINPNNQELLVKGDCLLSGYWSKGQLVTAIDDAGWYSTGDKVSLNSSGELLYHGRLDRMLKCSGYRIEPAEIEKQITLISGVAACAAVGIDDESSGQRPAAALILHPNSELSGVVNLIREKLPAYMQPSRLKVMTEFPYLSNGKIDYLSITREFNGD